ncbi:MAG: tetratricopeptide repeat protein [Cyanobacteria bacterium P01_D01_bin.115]
MPLPDTLHSYEQALEILEKSQGKDELSHRSSALNVLSARDKVQHLIDETPSVPAAQLFLLSQLDDRLKANETNISRVLELNHWRSLLNPPESAWWWYPEPAVLFPFLEKSYVWLDRLDWLWTFLSLFFLTAAVTVVLDTLGRVAGEGLNTQGMFPVIVQILLTLAGGSAALTEGGRQGLRTIMTRLRIPKHYWQEFSAIASLSIFIVVVGIYQLYLPQLANNRYQDGIEHYESGQFDSALQAYQQALALRPDFVKAHYSLGLIYEDLQQTDKAIAAYELVVGQDPDAVDKLIWLRAHNNLGRLYILDEQYRTAWIPLERAFSEITETDLASNKMGVEHYNLLKNLGWMWLGQGRLLEADEFLSQAIAQNPQRTAAHCLQAQVLEGLVQKDSVSDGLEEGTSQREEETLAAWANCLSGERKPQPEEAEWAAIARERLEGLEAGTE